MSINREQLDNIERLEAMEEKFGIYIEGINAEIQYMDDMKTVTINGEVFSTSGKTIADDIEIVVTAYNKEGKVIETESEIILCDDFFALQPLQFIFMDIIVKPERIRIYPIKYS